MDLKLKGKTAFITGSTAGIGFAVAKSLLQEGAKVILNGRKQKGIDAAVNRLKAFVPNADVKGITADFSEVADVDALIAKLPQVDILINNVGTYASQSFYETSDAEWLRQFEVNVLSGVRLSRHLLPKMVAADWGRIIFISSECATLVPADLVAYSTTKAAILAVSRGLAQVTEGAAQFLDDLATKENNTREAVETAFFRDVRTASLLQRFASVEEVAHTITYLTSPLAAATNGAAIKVDGGSMGGIL